MTFDTDGASIDAGHDARAVQDRGPDTPGGLGHEGELFPGDTGILPAAVRSTLVRVMTSRFIDGLRRPDLWNAVLTHEVVLTSRLHDLYVELVIDRAHQVAFTRQAEIDDVPVLLRREKHMPALTAVLLLHLREEYERGTAEGAPTVVDHDLLLDHLDVWRRADDQDPATFRKRSENAITALKDRQILVPVSEGRYRISGIIVPLFTPEKIALLTEAFEEIVTAPDDPGAATAPDSDREINPHNAASEHSGAEPAGGSS
jgi:Domain of unknown function (DUF4194)